MKRKAYQAIKAAQAKLALKQKRKVQKGIPLKFKHLEEFLKNSKRKSRDETRLARLKHRPQVKGVSPKVIKAIQMLRLRKLFSGTFVKVSKASIKMLKTVEPYVAWGYPNLKSVRELLLKRGLVRIDKRKIPLTDNTIIEQHLGQYGIICLEDLIHEIYSAGKKFRVVNNFLYPFRLSVPRHAARDKIGLIKDVGDPGPRAEDINTVIRKLN
ncbi:60S ribosomal protein L7-like 1 [Sinocyclocheilus grahami]|uniref:60S ribosomal protein L7-like 1 n=1 Tax=Sinocyclocheilus grahami TaxID=75366 RepID=UPI0007ACC4B5|nr:PREDICTED: 60S ribosomal protein L7-like 1 [Sinocyclocheilus grahami]